MWRVTNPRGDRACRGGARGRDHLHRRRAPSLRDRAGVPRRARRAWADRSWRSSPTWRRRVSWCCRRTGCCASRCASSRRRSRRGCARRLPSKPSPRRRGPTASSTSSCRIGVCACGRRTRRAPVSPTPASVRALDVAVLHGALLGPLLGVEPGQLEFTHDDAEAIDDVRRGRSTAAFLLNPPSVAAVRAVCLAGELMPEKSTYFYPKLASGLVFDRSIQPRPPEAPATCRSPPDLPISRRCGRRRSRRRRS